MLYLFNSFDFILFFLLVFSTYWVIPARFRPLHLIIASYIAYASWDWRFLLLLIFSSVCNYAFGQWISSRDDSEERTVALIIGLSFNLAILAFFKYFNFFIESLSSLLLAIGFQSPLSTLHIILPLGISFYTFQKMSYLIDVYRKEAESEKNLFTFLLFSAYFPQLIAGPIERAKEFIPKLKAQKAFADIEWGASSYLFIYGLFKKVVIADSLGRIVDSVFSQQNPEGSAVLIALYAFAIQIYCDFSGYTDMARGISGFLGINLSRNFDLPYFSKTPSEFWRRWHITLSNWVRDYLYVPMGGKHAPFFGLGALFLTWVIMGLWHGAGWNFVLWGIYWFVLIALFRLFKKEDESETQEAPSLLARAIAYPKMLLMFHLTVLGWLLFRGQSMGQIATFASSLLHIDVSGLIELKYGVLYASFLFLLIYEALQRHFDDEQFIVKKNFYYQMIFYLVLFFMFVEIGATSDVRFIYFQF